MAPPPAGATVPCEIVLDCERTACRVVAFEPNAAFNRMALEAVRRWRFEPMHVNGKAVVRTGQQIVIRFRKEDHRDWTGAIDLGS